jgi:cell division protein FtsW
MKKLDYPLLIAILLLTVFGLFMIYNSSSYIAFRDFSDKYHYIKEQAMWATIGIAAFATSAWFPYKKLYHLSIPLLIVAILLLLMIFIPGVGVTVLGAKRWINLGFTTLQPAEFVKLSLAIYLAAWFSTKEKERFLAFCLLIGTVFLLVMLQPDMGTASIILFEAILLYFLSGASLRHFLLLVPIIAIAGGGLILLEPYRAARLISFLNLHSLDGVSYHVKQILIALGSGGVFGVGAGNSLQKYAYLPENVTDSIFAIVAEEFGFIGAGALIALFLVVIWRGFVIATNARDTFGKLLAGGITGFLGFQIALNLSAMTMLVPLTGVPLPFISYGGSALIINLCAIGILLSISRTSHHA